MGSVRSGRRCETISKWVMGIGEASSALAFELVDLADWPLPFDDEPGIPAMGHYTNEHTLAWSRKIAGARGFVIVTPQYNWGYPAVLKNALDHLYTEWSGKPLMIVTYGGHGGGECAAQLSQVAKGLHMHPVPTMPGLTIARSVIESGASVDPERDFRTHLKTVRRAFRELEARLQPKRPMLKRVFGATGP